MERMNTRSVSKHLGMLAGTAFLVGLMMLGASWSLMVLAQEASTSETPPASSEVESSSSLVLSPPISKKMKIRLERYESFLRRFDTNRDDVIDPKEVEPSRYKLYKNVARHADLDPSESISLVQWRAALLRRYQPAASESPSQPTSGSQADQGESLVPGFGVEQDLPPVPGFGEPTESDEESKADTPESSGSYKSSYRSRHSHGSTSTAPSKTASASSEMEYKVRRYAESLLKRYDTNKSGVLERDEWSRMRTDPKSTDRNNDKVITLEELTAKLIDYSKKKSSWKKTKTSSKSGSRDSNERDGMEHPTYRQRSASERLPEGLPDWFAERDTNADGQVSMAEYSSRWSDTTIREFTLLDSNGDGVITSSEYFKSEL